MAAKPPDYEERVVYGPFHRRVSTTQTAESMGKIARRGELRGTPSKAGGGPPRVQAYQGRLEPDQNGFEFFTFAEPNRPWGPEVTWRTPSNDLVRVEDGIAKISVLITRIEQDIVWPE
jgi:hypothetical protein